MLALLFKLLIALVVAAALFRLGLFVLRAIAHPPEPPAEGELRRVNLRYRCSICGAEVRMVQASEDLPEPPRHCQEEMDLVAPPIE